MVPAAVLFVNEGPHSMQLSAGFAAFMKPRSAGTLSAFVLGRRLT